MAALEGHRPVDSPARLEGHSDKTPSDVGREKGGKAPAGASNESHPAIKASFGQS
jgi:hypothetical protein